MNAIFQASAYVPSVQEYSEYESPGGTGATKKVVDLFHTMYRNE